MIKIFVYMYDTNGILRGEIPIYWISFSSYVDAKSNIIYECINTSNGSY